MKSLKHFLTVVFALSIPMNVFGQVILEGVVLEYQGLPPKRPLSGVEILVKGAGSTISGQDGTFSLNFRTKAMGDVVEVRRIEKLDYEVFNTDAVRQWNIGSSFTIVMCKKALFKNLRDQYFKVCSSSYAKQHKKEQDDLKKLKKCKQLKEEEYQQKMRELRNNYQDQLENLESYAERFARIDLSELSDAEKRIIGLVQKGRIDEAIAEYEKLDYLKKYKLQTTDIQRVNAAIDNIEELLSYKTKSRDSIYTILNRQIDLYIQQGGDVNLNRVAQLLKAVAEADTTNLIAVMKYAKFSELCNEPSEALRFYKIAVNLLSQNEDVREIVIKKIDELVKKED